jgi:D-3-phosphoglycerate dehydrogenase
MSQPSTLEEIYEEFLAVVPSHYDVRLYDLGASAAEQLAGIDAVVEVGGSVATTELLDLGQAANLRLWQILGTGLDHVDVAGFLRRGIVLANTPGQFSAIALAEHALFFMLSLSKNSSISQAEVRAGRLYNPINRELAGQTLGLVGFGASARELAVRANGLGMRMLAYELAPVPQEVQDALNVTSYSAQGELDEVVREADYLSIHVPLTRTTRHLLDARLLALMKPTSVVINVARGEIIDQAALTDALLEGRLAGAGLDVFATEPLPVDHPLLGLDNVIVTPHVAGVTHGTIRRRVGAGVENLRRVEQGLEPQFLVLEEE